MRETECGPWKTYWRKLVILSQKFSDVLSLCLKRRFAEIKSHFQQCCGHKLYLFPAPFPFTPLALANRMEGTLTGSAECPAKARFLRAPETPVPLLYFFVNFLTYLVGYQTPMQLMSLGNISEILKTKHFWLLKWALELFCTGKIKMLYFFYEQFYF